MRSTTEHAADIRATLKREHGWSTRQVSVQSKYFSLGSAIRVEINDPRVPLVIVQAIAERAERIHRDQWGEILGGGNTYVTVRYSTEAEEILGRRYADAVQRAVDAVPPGSNGLEIVEGTNYLVGRPDEYRISVWNHNRYVSDHHSVDSVARLIGCRRGPRD